MMIIDLVHVVGHSQSPELITDDSDGGGHCISSILY